MAGAITHRSQAQQESSEDARDGFFFVGGKNEYLRAKTLLLLHRAGRDLTRRERYLPRTFLL